MNAKLRHDAIVRTLRRNGSSTVDALAVELGASRRTVLRDISALRDEGYVIHSDVIARDIVPPSARTVRRRHLPDGEPQP